MAKPNRLILSVSLLVGVALLLSFLSARSALPIYGLMFQSELPTPIGEPPVETGKIMSASGGRVYCGSTQSASWLDIPAGFTSDWGAEIHCSAAVPLADWADQTGMWDNQGYLIGIYPATAPIVNPLIWVHEVDPVRITGACDQCLVGRYYRPTRKVWVDLPTVYDASLGRVKIEIGEERPASGYPGYADRLMVALFEIKPLSSVRVRPTSAVASSPTPTATSPLADFSPSPTGTPTNPPTPLMPTASPLTASPTAVHTPMEPAATNTVTPPTPQAQSPETSTPAPSPSIRPMASPTTSTAPISDRSGPAEPPDWTAIALSSAIAVLSVALVAVLVLLLKERHKKS